MNEVPATQAHELATRLTLLAPLSVLMSTYHAERPENLALAIGSCLDQILPPKQVVLVLDGPVGSGQEAVIEKASHRAAAMGVDFVVLREPVKQGLATALNAGLARCTCEYIARMDSDDFSAPNRFDAQWGFLERHPEVDLLGAWQAEFETTPEAILRLKTMPAGHDAITRILRWRNVISHPSVVFRKSLVARIGGYRSLRYLEDYDLFMRVVEAGGKLDGIQEPLILVRVSKEQRARRGGLRYALDEWRFRWGLCKRSLIGPHVFIVSGFAYLGFRLTPAWLKHGLYGLIRSRSPEAGKSMGAVKARAADANHVGMPTRPLRLATMHSAAALLWHSRPRRAVVAGRIPVLCYHRILPGYTENDGPVYNVEPQRFLSHLRALASEGFTTLSLGEYGEIARGAAPAPERSVLITFDDGYADFVHLALPIAASERAKLNLFLCTGLPAGVGPRIYGRVSSQMASHRRGFTNLWRALTWSELRSMKEAGTGIGYHSHWHGNYGSQSVEATQQDVRAGLALWRWHLGALPSAFAFPMGGHGTHPESAVEVLRENGFNLMFSTRLGRTPLPTGDAVLHRIVMHQQDDVETLRRKVLGAYDWLGGLRGLDQAVRSIFARP